MKRPPARSRTLAACTFAAALALCAPAQAINLAPNGKGEVLIFPYYTVRSGFDTLISVTNTSDRTVLANLRLREAKNARSVREFHLALSPHDVWTGAVTTDGADGALIRTFDRSCIVPAFGAGPNGSSQIALTTSNYSGSLDDQGGSGPDRLREGFIEVIEMAISTVPESAIPAAGASIETSAQHVDGTPRSCGTVQDIFLNAGNFDLAGGGGAGFTGTPFASFEAPKNVLFGSATLINIGSGQAYDATPTAIQNFQDTVPIIFMPDQSKPTLAHGSSAVTAQQFDGDGRLISTPNIASSVDAVSVLLMARLLNNEFASGSTATSSARTDWVVTFPTKHFYSDPMEINSNTVLPPFREAFIGGRSCDVWGVSFSGREEQFDSLVEIPENPLGPCYSTNVVFFRGGATQASLFGSAAIFGVGVPTTSVGSAGWAQLSLHSGSLHGFSGLPAIGFAAIERNNSAEAGNNRNYGSGRPHVVELIAP